MQEIIKILKDFGPLTGKELQHKSSYDAFLLWRICNQSGKIYCETVGQKYLRLDRRIEGFARLSPSILREFLTYTIVGLKADMPDIKTSAENLLEKIKKISIDKFELSKEIISSVVSSQDSSEEILKKSAFIIAGDIVYNMAHNEFRPESSTNEMVKGSDLDIIVVTEDLAEKIISGLDRAMHDQKYYFLKMPAYREEIDYIIKGINRLKKQLSFDNFEFMVACKILDEGMFLLGSSVLFQKIKELLAQNNITVKLKEMERTAIAERENAKACLINYKGNILQDEYKNLFYTTEETGEIF